ncbi:glycoside hydrolase family 3 protein [Legionella sp. km772]|nr:glycoside hydrolase family 3 protein [Legionella sp. km772]
MHYIEEDNIGGVILFDYNPQSQSFDKNIENPAQVQRLNQQLQAITHQSNERYHRPQIPLLISVDYEGGKVNRLHPRYGFPAILSAKEIGKMGYEEANNTAKLMASVLKNSGFNLDFAPVLDVDVNPDNPIIGKLGRSFSADPNSVTQYGQLYSKQFLAQHIECSYKHFPGHGSSITDSHLGFVDITNTWSVSELTPFLQLLSQTKHCGMVMVAHVVNRNLDASGLPATLSFSMISGLLRHDLQFNGVVITDDMQMKAIADYYGLSTALTLAINAGADMFIFGNQLVDKAQEPKELIDLIAEKVQSGEIPEARIDEAYRRIIQMKSSLKN